MSHPRKPSVAARAMPPQFKTVFLLPKPKFKALLLESSGKSETLHVSDANAALAWCVEHGASLLYLPPQGLN